MNLILSLLKSKWSWLGVAGVALTAYLSYLKLSYSELELTHQSTVMTLQNVSTELTEAQSVIAKQKEEQERLASAKALSESLSTEVANTLDKARQENSSLKQSITKLKQENTDVKAYLDTSIPASVLERLQQ